MHLPLHDGNASSRARVVFLKSKMILLRNMRGDELEEGLLRNCTKLKGNLKHDCIECLLQGTVTAHGVLNNRICCLYPAI